ncbi:MAG: hypothetical protein OSB33_03435 [Candidatus Poseidoniales archaeon]|nr:hypothetical protein [Candidatus Poseidoniales archaeon]
MELAGDEDYLLECLDVAIKAGDVPEKRRRKAMDTSAWDLLKKPWKGLLLVALNKEEISNKESSNNRQRRMRGRGRRARNSTTDDWIEEMEGLVSPLHKAPPGYRLSAMLVQRARLGDKWNPTWDSELEKMRNSCAEGIHPVWPRLGREAPLLAEMQSYPEIEISNITHTNSREWIISARFDPTNRTALATWLKIPAPFPLTADLELSIQRIAKSLQSKGKVAGSPDSFNCLEGEAVLLKALVGICSGSDETKDDLTTLIESGGDVATVAKDHLALLQLRSGENDAWADCHGAKGDDALSVAMRYQSWIDAPDDAELTAKEIQEGVLLLNDAENQRALMWSLVAAHIRENNHDLALKIISELNLVDSTKLHLVLKLIEASGDEVLIERVMEGIHRIENEGLELIMRTIQVPLQLRMLATIEIQDSDGFDGNELEDLALDIFTESGNANRIGSILMKMEDGAIMHPHRTLLVHHLLPGNADQELCEWVIDARPKAIQALTKQPSGVLSETSIGLVKLLEGAPADLDAIRDRVAGNREAIRAFNQCRQAMLKGGDGLVPADHLDKLQSSIQNSSLSGVELRLFSAVLDRLRFNRAIRLLDDHSEESTNSALSTLNSLIGENPRKRIVDAIRQVVLEHDSIAIPAFAEWHRMHASPSSSSWHQIILASIEEEAGKHQSAGRSLRRASIDVTFSFENRVRLARRALIAFAHAGKFSEAIQMLESQQALQSAMTGIFQLYLHVCDDVAQQQPEVARRRLLNWISSTEIVSEENVDGEIVERERTTYPSDELDLLFTYPNAHGLPQDLWQGRIRAAKRGLSSNRRSQRSQLEDRFQHALDDGATIQEVESVAGEASALNPTQGLMMFERAMNSGQFSNNQMKALLRSQNGIFRLNEVTLPIRVRRKLRHLTLQPLILIDTNLLIDAAKERISWLLDKEGGIETNLQGSFHRTILYKSNAGMVKLRIPIAAEKEFKNKMGEVERVRTLFDDIWLDEVEWVEKVTREEIDKICKQVLADYSTWHPPLDIEKEAGISDYEEQTIEFMVNHRKTYLELLEGNAANKKRTKIGKDAIYPERGDRDIMREAAMLADSTNNELLKAGIGAILVASRDSDFWIVRRSLEETFGFGVVRTARELSQWA